MPEDPRERVEFQFWDGGDEDFHGSDEDLVTGARAFVVTHVEADVAFDLSHGED